MYKLSKEELRIIEQTKREGEGESGKVRWWPVVALALFIAALAVGVKLFLSWLSA